MASPKIVKGLSDMSAKDGESLEMSCEFKGEPEPHGRLQSLLSMLSRYHDTRHVAEISFSRSSIYLFFTVEWFKNGEALVSSDVVSLKYRNSVATLTISELFPEDEGTYQCKATNSEGSTETSCTLTVIRKEIFIHKMYCNRFFFSKQLSNPLLFL